MPPASPRTSSSAAAHDMLYRSSTSERKLHRFSKSSSAGRSRLSDATLWDLSETDDQEKDEHGLFSPSSFSAVPPLPHGAALDADMTPPTGPISCVRECLPSASHTEFELFVHLQHIPKANNKDTITALGDVFRRRSEITASNLFSLSSDVMVESDAVSGCEVLEVVQDGVVVPRFEERIRGNDEVLYSSAAWNMIKNVNRDKRASGRITILQRPCPATFAGIHFTMQRHFDMDELLAHLVSHKAKKRRTAACVALRAFEPEPMRQRTFFFVLRYYTVVGEDLSPASWQRHDGAEIDRATADHVDIAECSSVVALSLGGPPAGQVPPRRGLGNKGARPGVVYDTFAPFHVLHMQCFPDHVDSEPGFVEGSCYSGPHAFLECLVSEYKAAVTRLSQLSEQIEELVIPSSSFIFDNKLRDKLLFEDAVFTFSRRYFWAYNSLTTINDSMWAMIGAYHDTFTGDFWLGRHPTLWPHPHPDSAEGRSYLAQLSHLRAELDGAAAGLRALIRANEQLKQKIDVFREQVYSGSSVRENRSAVEQGENIKILTAVSMLFNPLTFVTGVFGMDLVDIPPTDWRFSVILVAICIPFFVLVFVLQTHAGASLIKRMSNAVTGGWTRRARARRERRSQLQHAAMIRRQSCAESAYAADRQGSLWTLMADRKGKRGGGAARGGRSGGGGGGGGGGAAASGDARRWRKWRRLRAGPAPKEPDV